MPKLEAMEDTELSLNLVNTPTIRPERKRKADSSVDKGSASAKKQPKVSAENSAIKSKYPLKERNEKTRESRESNFEHRKGPPMSKASKSAKFSSLFKNNPQIPTSAK